MRKTRTKTCTRCRLAKSRSQFCRDKRNKDGLGSWCKQCYREYSHDQYHRDLEHSRAVKLANYYRGRLCSRDSKQKED